MIRPPLLLRSALLVLIGRLAACVLLVGMMGCEETAHVSRYAVPKETADAGTSNVRADDELQPLSTTQEPQTAWFLKLLGPDDAVSLQQPKFTALVSSMTLDGDEPKWTLPEGWSEESGTGMRFATFTIDGTDPPLEVSVIKLPIFGGRDEYLLQNINRWRGQVGLDPWSATELAAAESDELQQTESETQSVIAVNFAGTTSEFGDSRMLAAVLLPVSSPVTSPQRSERAMPVDRAPSASEPLTYEAPEEWQPGRRSVMRVVAFEVTDGERKAEVTVIPAGGDMLSNVNRWREQVGLPPWTAAHLDESTEQITVNGQAATYVRLEGTSQTILAAVLPQGQQSWFFKLMGDTELAQREEERFRAFIESVHFK